MNAVHIMQISVNDYL